MPDTQAEILQLISFKNRRTFIVYINAHFGVSLSETNQKLMKKIFSMLFVALVTISAAQAQSADEIAAKYVKAIGGAKAWKAIKSTKLTISMNMQGMDLPGFIISDNKNRQRVELNFQGMKIVQAFDGQTAWAVSPPQGITTPTPLPEAQAKGMKEFQFLNDLIDHKKRGTTITYDGEGDIEGVACYKIKVVTKEGKEETVYIDKSNYMKVASETVANGQTMVSHYSDFKEIDGVKAARKIVVKVGGQTFQSLSISEIENNVEVGDDTFAYKGN